MLQQIFNKSKYIILTSLLGVCLLSSSLVFAQVANTTSNPAFDNALKSMKTTAEAGDLPNRDDKTSVSTMIGKIIGTVLSTIGVIFFVLTIYAGVLWMTAAGNEADTKKAKDILKQAVIGLIIIFSAYAITAFIGDSLTTTGGIPK